MIIGISGKARSGKDQFAEYLVSDLLEEHGRGFLHVAFADELKQMCREYFGLSYDQLWGDEKESTTIFENRVIPPYCAGLGKLEIEPRYWSAREIMQEVGSFFRKIDYNFWVNRVDKLMSVSPDNNFIITDVRHINECEYIKNNGILIKVVREEADKIHGMEHESETALDDRPDDYFDITVENFGTLKDLFQTAHEVASAVIIMNDMKNQGRVIENG